MRSALVIALIVCAPSLAAAKAKRVEVCGERVKPDATDVTCVKTIDVAGLARLPKLRALTIRCATVKDFGVLAKLPITALTIEDDVVPSYASLRTLGRLESLVIDDPKLADLA